MTHAAARYLAHVDFLRHGLPYAEQLQQLDEEIVAWLDRLHDGGDEAAVIVRGLVERRRALLAAWER